MSVKVNALDHLVINVSDVARSAKWYEKILGMEIRVFDPGPGKTPRTSLVFGNQKINVRPRDADKIDWFKTNRFNQARGTEDEADETVEDANFCGQLSFKPVIENLDQPIRVWRRIKILLASWTPIMIVIWQKKVDVGWVEGIEISKHGQWICRNIDDTKKPAKELSIAR